MKTDFELCSDVKEELAVDPSVDATNLAVSARNGIVTLSGFVPSYGEKYAAERAAFRVSGVKAVAEEIEVKLAHQQIRTDQELAAQAVNALQWHISVPASVKVAVEDGVIILRGDVEWQYQREAAAGALRWLTGVKEVKNRISIQKGAEPQDIKERIEKALVRSAEEEASRIIVSTSADKVILHGTVSSVAEMEAAKWAAWATPGVRSVESHLSIA